MGFCSVVKGLFATVVCKPERLLLSNIGGTKLRCLLRTNTDHILIIKANQFTSSANTSSSSTNWVPDKHEKFKEPSPYKHDEPVRYGYKQKIYTGGLLPRINLDISSLPQYRPKDAWSSKRALFGQNDYIDILGDGNVQPFELIRGPRWLIGFRGNEFQRLVRRLKFEGKHLRNTQPKKLDELNKRIRFLYKNLNVWRHSHAHISRKV